MRGQVELCGQRLDLDNIMSDLYVVSAINRHIVPWRSAYATTQHTKGACRFVLSSGGHIAGIVNPPGPKPWLMTAPDTPPTSQEWEVDATRQKMSWWEDWTTWSTERAGPLGKPPLVGSAKHKVLGDGPGEYVYG